VHSYELIERNHSIKVSQTINDPIMIADYLELGEAFALLVAILFFAVIVFSWKCLLFSVAFIAIVSPWARKNFNRGIYLHWPYQVFGMSLPGLFNPKNKFGYSD